MTKRNRPSLKSTIRTLRAQLVAAASTTVARDAEIVALKQQVDELRCDNAKLSQDVTGLQSPLLDPDLCARYPAMAERLKAKTEADTLRDENAALRRSLQQAQAEFRDAFVARNELREMLCRIVAREA